MLNMITFALGSCLLKTAMIHYHNGNRTQLTWTIIKRGMASFVLSKFLSQRMKTEASVKIGRVQKYLHVLLMNETKCI